MKKQPVITAAKLRAIADRIERDAMSQVGELRRLADLLDGVARVTRTKAKKKAPAKGRRAKTAAKTAKAKKLRAALKKKPARAKPGKRRGDRRQIDLEDLLTYEALATHADAKRAKRRRPAAAR